MEISRKPSQSSLNIFQSFTTRWEHICEPLIKTFSRHLLLHLSPVDHLISLFSISYQIWIEASWALLLIMFLYMLSKWFSRILKLLTHFRTILLNFSVFIAFPLKKVVFFNYRKCGKYWKVLGKGRKGEVSCISSLLWTFFCVLNEVPPEL